MQNLHNSDRKVRYMGWLMNTIIFVGAHPTSSDVKWHTHETWELVYCTSGQGTFRFRDGRDISYQKGELVAVPPNTVHSNSAEEGFANIHLNMLDPAFPCRDSFKVQDENELLLQAMVAARINYLSDKRKRETVLAALGDLIAGYMVVFQTNTRFTEPVEQIRQEILSNHTNPEFALDVYIRTMPFHYDYLRKIFKKETGLSPLAYLTSLRMKNAERLLSAKWSNGRTVAEIARMCGYDNALYFSRVFKKHYGYAPSQFVNRQRQVLAPDHGRAAIGEQE